MAWRRLVDRGPEPFDAIATLEATRVIYTGSCIAADAGETLVFVDAGLMARVPLIPFLTRATAERSMQICARAMRSTRVVRETFIHIDT